MRVTNPSVFTKQATCTADTARKKNLRLALRKISLNDFCPHRTSSMGDLEGSYISCNFPDWENENRGVGSIFLPCAAEEVQLCTGFLVYTN